MRPATKRCAEGLAITAFYGLVAAAALGPIAAEPGRTMLAAPTLATEADRNLILWILAWGWHGLTTAPAQFFDANIFHPFESSFASSEHMLGVAPIAAPVFAVSGNPVLAHAAAYLAGIALSGTGLYALLRHWGAPVAAAAFGGFAYAFLPTRFFASGQLQLVHGQYLPLALLFLDKCLREPRIRDAALYALFLAWQVLCSVYLGFAALLGAAAFWIASAALALRDGRLRSAIKGLALSAAATLVAGAFLLGVHAPYIERQREGTIRAAWPEAKLRASSNGWVDSYLARPRPGAYGGLTGGRHDFYFGILPLGFAALALLRAGSLRTRERSNASAVVLCLALVVMGYLLALGPRKEIAGLSLALPYSYLQSGLPGFGTMRLPGRFGYLTAVGVAALAGLGLAAALRNRRFEAWVPPGRRRLGEGAIALVLIAVTGWDLGLAATRKYDSVESTPPPIYGELAELPRGPVVELPIVRFERGREVLAASRAMVASTQHWFPLLGGYGGYTPPGVRISKALANALPDPRALELLVRATGLRYVILHEAELRSTELARWRTHDGLRLLGRHGSDRLFEVASPTEADLVDALSAIPPAPSATLIGTPVTSLAGSATAGALRFAAPPPGDASVGALVPLRIEVENRSTTPWPALTPDADSALRLAFAWRDSSGKRVQLGRGIRRGHLPYDLLPGEKCALPLDVAAPPRPGSWRLEIGLAQGDRRFPSTLATLVEVRELRGSRRARARPGR